jgi:co-chaperonin GroES (HSP10)
MSEDHILGVAAIPCSMIEDRVLIEVLPLESTSAGGIIIPQTAMKEKTVREGLVRDVGPKAAGSGLANKQVMFHHIGTVQVFNSDGVEFYIVEYNSVLGIVEP